MMKRTLFMFFVAALFVACEPANTEEKTEAPEATEEKVSEAKPAANTFGETITGDNAITMTELLGKMGTTDSIPAKLTGTVEAVCQVKGCWMNIVSDNPDEGEIMVKFKDYGFFMPLDIAGRKVVMDGYAFREVTPVDELKHYAEDEGQSAEEIAAITEPKEELKFLASGVLLLEEEGE